MVFGVPCVTIVAPVCDRVPAGRSAFPGHAVTWSIQVEWLLAACGIHGVLQESQASVHAHSGVTPFVVSGWPLLFECIYDISGLQHVNKLTIERRFRKYSLWNLLTPFFPLECNSLMHKTHFISLWGGWKMHFSCPFHDFQLVIPTETICFDGFPY